MTEFHSSFCRVCLNFCPVIVETDGARVKGLSGAPGDVHKGYTCTKGRAHPQLYDHPDRLLHSLKRKPDGGFMRIPTVDALDEIAERLMQIRDRTGPRSIASFVGTYFGLDSPISLTLLDAFHTALKSPMAFNTASIDQPGKALAPGLHGAWMAPSQAFAAPNCIMVFGANPIISLQARYGQPGGFIKDLERRGGDLIVFDPRRSETARRATQFVQPRPGEDVALIAAIIRLVIEEGLYDADFVAENVNGFERLRASVAPFTIVYAASRAGVSEDELIRAARTFARAGRGNACAGTGGNMGGRGTLVEYLLLCLNTICGYWMRAGEPIPNPAVLTPASVKKAQANPPFAAFGYGEKSRVRGLTETRWGMPATTLADEILLEGEGQVRALISMGANPVNCIPDQVRVIEAFRSLELLVHCDVQMTPTAKLAHYVLAPTIGFETNASTMVHSIFQALPAPWAQYAPAIVEAPEGADVMDQWRMIYHIAQRMGLPLEVFPGVGHVVPLGEATPVDTTEEPDEDALMAIVHKGSRIPFAEVKAKTGGGLFPGEPQYVAPKDPGWEGRLDVGAELMMRDLRREFDSSADASDPGYPFRLLCRRNMHVHGSPIPATPKVHPPYNPVYMHPSDAVRLGLVVGDTVEIASARASIVGVLAEDKDMRPGTVSMIHNFGDLPELDDQFRRTGSNTGRLVDNEEVYDPYSGQSRMSNVPVRIMAASA